VQAQSVAPLAFPLTHFDDDAIVVVPREEDESMLWKTYEAFQERLDYAKRADGSWVAEFSGPFRIKVTDSNLERCRQLAITALDERLVGYVVGSNNPAHMARRVLRSSSKRATRVKS
jgi:hypothetical protein